MNNFTNPPKKVCPWLRELRTRAGGGKQDSRNLGQAL